MAQHIVKDSHLPIFVQEVDVPQATKGDDWVEKGAIRGLAGYTPQNAAEDGKYYTTVDTAAEVRFDAVAGAFAIGDSVYRKTDGSAFVKAATAGHTLIGTATRPKAAAAGKLFVQLIPQAA